MNAIDEKCTVIENRNIRKNFFLMKLEAEYISSHCSPGNFIMLAASKSFDPLLKRPFGILRAESPFIWLYYEIVGKGTELIASLKPGEIVNAIGPLGNSFPGFENKNILMVAGGRGIAPVLYAVENYTSSNKVFLVYGAKSSDDLNLLDEINQLRLEKTFLYTDDGSVGKKGFVTDNIREIIDEYHIDATISCGPDAMFENLSHTLKDMKKKTENYVSMEALMGCGFGICYSCAVKMAAGGYKKVCSDGPVFKMEEIAWQTA
jgi:dihydroorotate dehydrogenase electron transfer subunit